jgi:hypothetical protein
MFKVPNMYLSCPAVSQISNFTIVESSNANVCDKKDAPTVTYNNLRRYVGERKFYKKK